MAAVASRLELAFHRRLRRLFAVANIPFGGWLGSSAVRSFDAEPLAHVWRPAINPSVIPLHTTVRPGEVRDTRRHQITLKGQGT